MGSFTVVPQPFLSVQLRVPSSLEPFVCQGVHSQASTQPLDPALPPVAPPLPPVDDPPVDDPPVDDPPVDDPPVDDPPVDAPPMPFPSPASPTRPEPPLLVPLDPPLADPLPPEPLPPLAEAPPVAALGQMPAAQSVFGALSWLEPHAQASPSTPKATAVGSNFTLSPQGCRTLANVVGLVTPIDANRMSVETNLAVNHTRLRRIRAAIILAVLLAPAVHYLALGTEVPEGTFFLLSRLDGSVAAQDPANLAYSLARPPVFSLMEWTFWFPLAYIAVGYAAHALLQLVMVWLVWLGAGEGETLDPEARLLSAAALALVAFPVLHLLRLDDRGMSLVPHDAWEVFSHRTLFWCLSAVATGALALGKTRVAVWVTALSCYMHPTAGVLSFVVVGSIVVVQALQARRWVMLLEVGGAFLVGLAPALVKQLERLPAVLSRPVSSGAWYSAMIKDEADDFSFLYQLLYRLPLCATIGAVILIALVAYALLVPKFHRRPMFWAALLPPVLFALGAVVERTLVVAYPTPLTLPLVALTPGYRLPSYSCFPLLVLAGGVVARFSNVARARFGTRLPVFEGARRLMIAAAVVALGWGLFLVSSRGHARPALRFARWAISAGKLDGIEPYLVAAQAAGMNDFKTPAIFTHEGPYVLYPGERNLAVIQRLDAGQPPGERDRAALASVTAESFAEIVRMIRARVKPGDGLFVPPYLYYFRDALINYPIVLQEHHDGNVMMGGPGLFGFFGPRMVNVMGFDYEGMPSQHSHRNFSAMREAFLSIDGKKARSLFARYPAYPYFVTEARHSLPFRAVARNGAFVVYDLAAPLEASAGASAPRR